MKINIILILLVALTAAIFFFDHEQLKLFFYALQRFQKNKLEPVPFKKRNIAIITAEDRDYPFIRYHDINFKKYADLHGYSYFRLDNCPKTESTTYWCKIHKIKEFLEKGYDYVMWADSDTIIPDINKSLDQLISNEGEPDIIIGKDNWWFDIQIICAGIFLIKNSEIGKSFINESLEKIKSKESCIIKGKEQGVWAGICYEQGVMNLLLREKYRDNVFIDNNNDYLLNIPGGYTAKYTFDKPIVVHLAGHPNDVREKIFKKYI